MKKSKNRGITLVALVVTIIILLILAGVAIGALTQTGLFENAKQAKSSMENAQEKEEKDLDEYNNNINAILGVRNNNENIIYKSILDKSDIDFDNGYSFEISTSYNKLNKTIKLTDSLENYDYIIFEKEDYWKPSGMYTSGNTQIIPVDSIKGHYTTEYSYSSGNFFCITSNYVDSGNRITLSFNNDIQLNVWSRIFIFKFFYENKNN